MIAAQRTVVRGAPGRILCSSRLDDGTWLDEDNDHDRPSSINAGQPIRLQTITEAVIGVADGDDCVIVTWLQDAFGLHDPSRVFGIVAGDLQKDASVVMRTVVMRNNVALDSFLVERSLTHAKLDANHPLAGLALTVPVKLLSSDSRRG